MTGCARKAGTSCDAVLQTCRERARPVVLTALSAILGVLPIAFGLGLEIFHQETTINAPSTQWWIALSSAIVFGLSFATVLTLIVTPSMLMVFTRDKRKPGQTRWLRLAAEPAVPSRRQEVSEPRADAKPEPADRRAGDRLSRRPPNSRLACRARRRRASVSTAPPIEARRGTDSPEPLRLAHCCRHCNTDAREFA